MRQYTGFMFSNPDYLVIFVELCPPILSVFVFLPMNRNKIIILVTLLTMVLGGYGCRKGKVFGRLPYQTNWAEIDTFFVPPPSLSGVTGNFRSPFDFYGGTRVTTRSQWAARRQEILNNWHSKMGAWPDFLTDQTLEIIRSESSDGFVQHTVRFKWLPNEYTEGYLLVPSQASKPMPAVITVFYEPETSVGIGGKPYRDFAYQLAKRGFVTLSLGTREASKAQTYSLYYPNIEHATIQPLSALAYAAANTWYALSKRPEVDSARIGIVGHSFGGKWAMFASCLFDKFACAVWSDPGIVFNQDRESVNYWEPWYLGYHPKPWRKRGLITAQNPAYGLYPELIQKGYDLHELHALMAPRPFLVSGGSEDPVTQWIPLNHAVAVNKFLGYEKRVGMTNRPLHDPNQESNEVIYRFFELSLNGKPTHSR